MENKNISNKGILVIGPVPPPYGGQALMIQRLLNAKFNGINLYHIDTNFTSSFKSIGKFSIAKIYKAFIIVIKAIKLKYEKNINVLYYFPAGPDIIPILRDIFILGFLKPVFRKKIYHFRSAGISEFLEEKTVSPISEMIRHIYGAPDFGIQLSNKNPKDANYFKSKNVSIIPNGLEDYALKYLDIIDSKKKINYNTKILYVGVIREDKGVKDLIEASIPLMKMGYSIKVYIVGEFASENFKSKIMTIISESELLDNFDFTGIQIGEDKWKYFAKSDIFCFPTYFNSESFGNVLIEAMMFKLPVIGTRWRGVQDIINQNKNGFLIPIKSPDILAEKIKVLIDKPVMRLKMGEYGRKEYLKKYTLDKYLLKMKKIFKKI